MVKTCIYCSTPQINQREIMRNNLCRAILTNIPITEGHALILPLRCVPAIADLSEQERLAIFDLADQLMAALKKTFGAEGFNCAWNQGELAGQSIPHFHLHIIPRKSGDTGLLGYDPRSLLYRTGDREPLTESALQDIAQKIKKDL